MKPTTAVIFAAGIGTRMLPITAAVQKELLPIGNRPVIDYIVADLVAAGIKRIIIVIRAGQTGIKDYYLGSASLERHLRRLGKSDALQLLSDIHRQAEFEFVDQPEDAGYGTAVPLVASLSLLDPTETVVVCGGDDFVWREEGSEMTDFVTAFAASTAEGAIMALEPDSTATNLYGALTSAKRGELEYLTDILEKPETEQAPARLVNISKYILSGKLRNYIKDVQPRPDNSERYITDGLNAGAQAHDILVHRVTGTYLDTGNTMNWLKANQVILGKNQE